MSVDDDTKPYVLCFSGLDPSGGAGLQADIQTLTHFGVHACPIITANTAQNLSTVDAVWPTPAEHVERAARLLLDELPIAAVKIGLIADASSLGIVEQVLRQLPHTPVVWDPVLRAGNGGDLRAEQLLHTLKETLLPLSHVITPNWPEAQSLAGATGTRDELAQRLQQLGAEYVLITGTHDDSDEQVTNSLYSKTSPAMHSTWPRLPGEYHGSGCTLASAIAAGLAQGSSAPDAVQQAQHYTWQALKRAYRPGNSSCFPNRLPKHEP